MPYFPELQELKRVHKNTVQAIGYEYLKKFKDACGSSEVIITKYKDLTMRQILTEVSGIQVSKEFMESAR